MSEVENTPPQDQVPSPESTEGEPVQNLKAEMNRKIDRLSETLNSQWQEMTEMLAKLQPQRTAPQQQQPVHQPLSELVYEGDKFDSAINQRINEAVNQTIIKQQQKATDLQAALQEVANTYPEFAVQQSEAYNLAMKKYVSLPNHLKDTAEGAQIALYKAASELGLVPVHKRPRTQDQDNFTLTGGGKPSKRGAKSGELTEDHLFWMEAFGLDTSDKGKERVKKHMNRNWGRYE